MSRPQQGTGHAADDLVLHDEERFWSLVQTIPDHGEAEDLLLRARSAILREKARRRNGPVDQEFAAVLSRIKAERARIRETEFRQLAREGVIELFGYTAWEDLRCWMLENAFAHHIREKHSDARDD